MEIEVRLPEANEGPSDDILVSRWHVAEGDPVTAGDDLVDVSFDKVDQTIPAPASGTLTRIVAAEGDAVDLNSLLGVITSALPGQEVPAPSAQETPPSDTKEIPSPTVQKTPPSDTKEMPSSVLAATPGAPEGLRAETEVRLPEASEGPSADALVSRWHAAEGDPIKAGADLVDVDFDKVIQTVPAPVSGILTKIVAAEGDTVDLNGLLGMITSASPMQEVPTPSAQEAPPSDAKEMPSSAAKKAPFSVTRVPAWGQNPWAKDRQ